MAKKAEGAGKEGDVAAHRGYLTSSFAFKGTVVTSGIAGADATTKGLVSRAIAKHIILRVAGSLATEAAVAAAASTVVSVVSGVGLVLLLVGIGGYIYAVVSERDSYERWAGRCYFSKDTAKRFEKASAEEAWLMAIDYEVETQEEVRRKALQYPDLGRDQPPPSNPMGDGWGGGMP